MKSIESDHLTLASVLIEIHGDAAEDWARIMADTARRSGNHGEATQWERMLAAIVEVRGATPAGPMN